MTAKERDQRYRDKRKADPERREEYARNQKLKYAEMKADPVRWAEYHRRKREEHEKHKADIDPAESSRKKKEAKRKWLDKIKSDPERYEEYKRQRREKARQDYIGPGRLRASPEQYAEHLRKQREIDRRRYATIKADPELYAEYLRKKRESANGYRETRREILVKKENERRAANPEAISKVNKERRAANPDKYREKGRKDYVANVDEYKRRARERRLRKANAPGYHTVEQWRALCSYYMDQCLACGDVPDKLTPDHIVPLVKGGSDDIENIQPLCLRCNISKGAKKIDYRI